MRWTCAAASGWSSRKPNPFPTMSIYDNVAAGLRLNGFHKRRELDEVVEHSLRMARCGTK